MDDVSLQEEGSIALLHLNSSAARKWVAENVQDDAQWFGNALVVEARYVAAITQGMGDSGLSVGFL